MPKIRQNSSIMQSNDSVIFTMYDDPNEVGEDDIEGFAPEELHERCSLETLRYRLISDPNTYYECTLKRKQWYYGDAFVCGSSEDPKYIHLPTTASCGRAFDGDTVVVKLEEKEELDEVGNNCLGTGRVAGILKRKFANIYEEAFTCRMNEDNCSQMIPLAYDSMKFVVVSPRFRIQPKKVYKYHRRLMPNCSDLIEIRNPKEIENSQTPNQPSQLFSVRYISWSQKHWHPKGYVESSFDALTLKRYMIQYRIPGKHSGEKERKAEKLLQQTQTELKNQPIREDLSDLYVFTIDDEKSHILDDALSIERCKEHRNCWKIGVHIADLGSRLPEKSEIDEEAKRRLMSAQNLTSKVEKDIDLTDGKLFPKNMIASCSLNCDDKEKFAVSTFFHSKYPPLHIYAGISESPHRFANNSPVLTIIKPKRKLTYTEAQQLICERKDGLFCESNDGNLAQQLYHLWSVMWQFRLLRLDSAAYYIDKLDSIDMRLNQCMARILVEEAMVTSNAYTAHYLQSRDVSVANDVDDVETFKVAFFARCQPAPSLKNMGLVDMLELSPYQKSFFTFFLQQNEDNQLQNQEDNGLALMPTLILRDDWKAVALQEILKGGILYKSHQKDLRLVPTRSASMVVTKNVWQNIESLLEKDQLELAVFLSCCDQLHPELGSSLSSFHAAQQQSQIKSSRKPASLSHFDLRLRVYTRCSSPLRRYIDLDTQRRLVNCLMNGKTQSALDTEICCKQIDRELDMEQFDRCRTVCQTYDQNLFRKDIVEGFVLALHEFDIVIFFPNCTVVRRLNIPLKVLGLEKRVGDGKLGWTVRYHDIEVQQRVSQDQSLISRGSAFETSFHTRHVVKTKPWKEFIGNLNKEPVTQNQQNQELLQRVSDSLTEIVEEHSEIAGIMRTSNGIRHARYIELKVWSKEKSADQKSTLGTSMRFQFGLGLEQGVEAVVPQLLLLTRSEEKGVLGLEVCMLHRRNINVFDISCDEITHEKEDFDQCSKSYLMYLYYQKWISPVRLDGLYSSVENCDSVTLQLERHQIKMRGTDGQIILARKFCEHCFVQIRTGDFLCLRKKNYHGDEKAEFSVSVVHGVVTKAVINDQDPSNVYWFKVFQSFGYEPLSVGYGDVVSCEVIFLGVSHRRMVNALSSLRNASSLEETLCVGKKTDFENLPIKWDAKVAVSKMFPNDEPQKVGRFPHPLNTQQYEQVKKALQHQFTLIQGPPGTGKSYMGAHLAYHFTQLNRRLNNKGKILYCGPSNKSVDVVAEYLRFVVPDLKFMRVYGGMIEEMDYRIPIKPLFVDPEIVYRVPDSLREYSLHHVIRQFGSSNFAQKIRSFDNQCKFSPTTVTLENYKAHLKVVNEAKVEALKKMDIILCTCCVAGGQLVSEFEFEQCIVDECGMCSEPETLIPIATTTQKNKNPQIVLIGDHLQLEPVTTCRRAANGGLKKSMFERLQWLAESLTEQYRMHPRICEFPSMNFYKSKLNTADSVKNRGRNLILNGNDSPAIFINELGAEEEDGSKSKFNKHQVKVAIRLVEALLREGVQPSNIMVLSPYLAQCKKLKAAIKDHTDRKLDLVHVGSVVTSQGSEADYVILSTVRSSDCPEYEFSVDQLWLYKKLGFLTDDHQINVAITRAKFGLVIIGNQKLLRHYSTWKKLLENYQGKRAIVNE